MKKPIICAITVILATASCEEKFEIDQPRPSDSEFYQEIAFPDRSGEVESFELKNGQTLSYERIDSFKVFEGDILLSDDLVNFLKKEDTTTSNNSARVASAPGALLRRWPNSTVNFRISLASRRADILWAINHVEANTNIDFIEATTGNYIDFVDGTGCSSSLGMQGGRQTIILATGCPRGSIVHEICHALGVFHEQIRPDRGNSIIINWGNIESGRSHNFETKLAHNYGPFDFGFIMMYGSWAFSSNGNPTITRLNGTTFAGQRTGLSTNDINALLDMYPGPNMIRSKGGTIDIGVNSNGDIAYLKKERYTVDVYKNDIRIASHRLNQPSCIDITSGGQVLINSSGYSSSSGKYHYKTIDISEGGGNIYCLSNNTKQTNLYKKSGSGWTLIASNIGASKITVDLRGRPWVLTASSIRLYSDNGSFTTIGMPAYSSTWDRLTDIGSAGNEIYVSMVNLKNTSNKQLLKYSTVSNQLIRQPGSANNLDGESNGVVWVN